MISAQKLIVLTLCLLVVIDAHTWLGCTDYKTDGSCAGFIRNYHARDTPGSDSTDEFYTNKLLGQDPNFAVCKSDTQATATYSAQFPRATARAGSTLKTMYTPNGHSAEGDVGETTFARIHWNRGPNGPNGDLRFRKDLTASNELSRTNYAVNCKTTGDVASLPCVNPYTIPRDTPPGVYQFVWYWPYNKVATQRPFGEEYYSCFEVNVLAADGAIPSTAAVPSSAPRTSASSSAPRTSASSSATPSSAPRTSASSSAPRTSASSSATPSSAPRTSASSSAARTSASSSRTRLQETSQQVESSQEDQTSQETTQETRQSSRAASSVASNNNSTSITDLDVASHSNKVIAIGLLTLALLI